ncbi:MAG TPA: hypothetical protein VNG31_02495 [Candidatus Baltobacteraceae bacterium]|nr:hypothetical protein [Candidatus Baltobacteraceae bacterium]
MAPAFLVRAMWLWIVLGAVGLAYMILCPRAYHTSYWDFVAGVLVGVGIVACFVRPAPSAASTEGS